MALALAIAGTRLAVATGLVSFEAHRFLASEIPVASALLGGALFGAGMVLTEGLRLAPHGAGRRRQPARPAHAGRVRGHRPGDDEGVLAPVRETLGAASVHGGAAAALTALPGGELWPLGLALAAALFALRSGAPLSHLAMGGAIGLLVSLGWVGTGFLLLDDFDPIPLQSLSFTGPSADTLFWTVAATAIPAGFGTGLVAGVIAGSLIAARLAGEFRWVSLESPRQTGRYLTGAVMMGVGGVLAGGCTVGAGLSGVSTASVAALLALTAMATATRTVGVVLAGR